MQYKNKFDKDTIRKIKKSFIFALSGPIGVALIDLSTHAPRDVWWGVVVSYVVPIIINTIREYKRGDIRY